MSAIIRGDVSAFIEAGNIHNLSEEEAAGTETGNIHGPTLKNGDAQAPDTEAAGAEDTDAEDTDGLEIVNIEDLDGDDTAGIKALPKDPESAAIPGGAGNALPKDPEGAAIPAGAGNALPASGRSGKEDDDNE